MADSHVLKVDRRAVEAAKLLMLLDQQEGRESSEAVKAIANAKRTPRKAAAS